MINLLNELADEPIDGRKFFSTYYVDGVDVKAKKILDIGCGFGWFMLFAKKADCLSVDGVEPSEQDLISARQYFKKTKNVTTKVGSAIDLPYSDNYFDTVTCWEVIEHIPKNSEPKMLKEIRRVLKKGGVAYISTPYFHLLSFIFDPAWWFMGHRHYSINKIYSFVKKSGLQLENIQIKGGWIELIEMIDLYFSKWILRRKPIFANILRNNLNNEYQTSGFMNIFFKVRKI